MKFGILLLSLWHTALFGAVAQPRGSSCLADINEDAVVDQLDYEIVRGDWMRTCAGCSTDLDGSQKVDLIDMLLVMSDFGSLCFVTQNVELAGNPLSDYPYFETVLAFNQGADVHVALDPTRFPAIVGHSADLYVVEAKTQSEWSLDPSLTDVTTGGFQTVSFVAGTIQDNTFLISGGASLDAEVDGGLGLGHPYDVVLDMNQNGVWDEGDLIDGLAEGENPLDRRHGFYVVHDTTQPGPLPVTEIDYSVTVGSATAGYENENIFYPTDIASMGTLPLIIVSHGNGHDYSWYDHVGTHMASYGYVVMSHANNTGPGVFYASTTTLEHTDAFLDQLTLINGGVLSGHIDTSRITWLGHSRGGEGVAIAVDRIFDGEWTPAHYTLDDIVLVSSIAPVDFLEGGQTDPHDKNYHLWTGGSDNDVNGCANCNLCQTFHLHDRATAYRQSISLHGVGHGDFHNGGGSSVATGPCLVGRPDTHLIMKGYLLPLVKHYVEGNIPARDFLWRQWERFKPIGAPTNPCVNVDLMYREGPSANYYTIDDFQSQPSTSISSSGGAVTFDVDNLTEGVLDDNNSDFTHDVSDPMNGMTVAGDGDDSAGVVFEFASDTFYEQGIAASARDFSDYIYLEFRAAQATRHPYTTAQLEDLSFTVTLRDGLGTTSSIPISSFGGGIEEPYQRTSCGTGAGWANEFETIRLRLTDFLNNGSGLDLTDIEAVIFQFGPSFGAGEGRIGLDDIAISKDAPPPPAGALSIGLIGGAPELIAPGSTTPLTVMIAGVIESPVPGSEMMHYRFDGGAYQNVPLTPLGNGQYEATLPAPACGDVVEYYFSAAGAITGPVFLPPDAPANVFHPAVGVRNQIYFNDFSTDPGWTVEAQWAYGQPTGGGGEYGNPDPTQGHTGPNVYGYNLDGDYENNMPEYHLTSTPIDCTGVDNVQLTFWRYLGVERPDYDHAYVRVSVDGTNWTTVWENDATITDSAWNQVDLDLTGIADGEPTVYLRWTIGVTDGGWRYCGWNIDDVELSAVTCGR